MSKNAENVKAWRKRTKERIIESMGGRCNICNYNRCSDALDLHHVDPTEKEVSLSGIRANPRSWARIVYELRKCVLLCANCHRELHAGIVVLPENYNLFDDEYVDYKLEKFQKETSYCPVCGVEKPIHNKTCSHSCAAKLVGKVDWDSVDLVGLLREHGSFTGVGEKIGVSDNAVRKRAMKLGLLAKINNRWTLDHSCVR